MTKSEIIKKLKYIEYEIEQISTTKKEECIYQLREEIKNNEKEIDFGYISYVSHEAEQVKEIEKVIKQIIYSEDK